MLQDIDYLINKLEAQEYKIVRDVKEWEVHAAIAYKLEKDPKNFELMNTINFLRRVHGDD